MGRKVAALARRGSINRMQYLERERSERRDASRHLARVQELGDRLDDELRLVDLLYMRGARYEHERPRGGNGVDHLSSEEVRW